MPDNTEAEIRLLPEALANQIAAGEVVQRPASVVKELLENAVDAGAASVQLIVTKAGKTLIQVIDDGKGMSPLDARMAFERHATSKIRNLKDLFSILTLGFRGEALASIAAVAHVTLKTRREQDALGVSVEIAGGAHQKTEPCQTPKGASVSVNNLFFNVPARRNFLKSDPVEMKHIIQEFLHCALANPGVAFELVRDGNSLHKLPAQTLPERLSSLYSFISADNLTEARLAAPEISITGWVGAPQLARKQRGEQFWFVNGRYIKSNYLNHAVAGAYAGLIADGRHPVFALRLDLPPEQIDINIHPTKTEIKFENERQVYAQVAKAVRNALAPFSAGTAINRKTEPASENPGPPSGGIAAKENDSGGSASAPFRPPAYKRTGRFDLDDFLNRNPPAQPRNSPRQEELPLETSSPQESDSRMEVPSPTHGKSSLTPRRAEYLAIEAAGIALFVLDDALHGVYTRACADAILFKRQLNALRENGGQPLMNPARLSTPPAEREALQASAEALATFGFDLAFESEGEVLLRAHPAVVTEAEAQALLAEVAAAYEIRATDDPEELGALLTEALQKRGQKANAATIPLSEIIAEIASGNLPETDPGGRLLWRKMEADEINRFFEKN